MMKALKQRREKRPKLASLLVFSILLTALVACGGQATSEGPNTLPPTLPVDPASWGEVIVEQDIVFSESDTEPLHKSMDVYRHSKLESAPALVFVHGGGWVTGDKSNVTMSDRLVDYFLERGFAFVAINFRLQQNPATPGIKYSDQASDVASALGYLRANHSRFGADPDSIVLMGYSSGAHLVALLGTDSSYLSSEGFSASDLKGIISLDVSAYDIPRAIEEACEMDFCPAADNLPAIFGKEESVQRDASPIEHLRNNESYPPFLIVSAGIKEGIRHSLTDFQSRYFVDALSLSGAEAGHFHAGDKSHTQLVLEFGATGNRVTEQVTEFIENLP